MPKLGKDAILKDLIEFFLEDFENDPLAVRDWVAQGGWDADKFVTHVRKLKRDLALRDGPLVTNGHRGSEG